jgi:hypothetical protein
LLQWIVLQSVYSTFVLICLAYLHNIYYNCIIVIFIALTNSSVFIFALSLIRHLAADGAQ